MIFGITGDLARKMTFEALYRLERRGELNCRSDRRSRATTGAEEELDGHAREAIEAKVADPDEEAIKRLDERLDYVQGEFDDDDLYERLAEEMGEYEQAVFYLEIPPSLFGEVVKRLHDAGPDRATRGWCSRSRSATTASRRGRSTPSSARCSTSRRSCGSTTSSARSR